MTRVATAAAITLQTWSRTVLAKKEVDAKFQEQKANRQKLLDFELMSSSRHVVGMEVWARRALLVGACIALVGMNLQGSDGAQQVLATSSTALQESSGSLSQGVIGLVSGAVPSLLYSSRRA